MPAIRPFLSMRVQQRRQERAAFVGFWGVMIVSWCCILISWSHASSSSLAQWVYVHSFCTLSAPVAHRARVHALVGGCECPPAHILLHSFRHRSRSCLRCSTALDSSLSAHWSFCTFLHLHRIISTLSVVCFPCLDGIYRVMGMCIQCIYTVSCLFSYTERIQEHIQRFQYYLFN